MSFLKETFDNDRVVVYNGDSNEVLASLEENSVDSIVTDPPYHLTSIVRRFSKTAASDDTQTSDRIRNGVDGYARAARGFMGQEWDGGDIAFTKEFWEQVFRVLKPGGHLVAFSASKNYHRMAVAIEDAGFEIRDQIMWLYGTGMPKSHNISKAIDKTLGGSFRKVPATGVGFMGPDGPGGYNPTKHRLIQETKQSDEAAYWNGWGSALKPAHETLVLGRKPEDDYTFCNRYLNEVINELWLILLANVVEQNLVSSLVDITDQKFDFAQLSVEEKSSILDDLYDQMGMYPLSATVCFCLNTVLLWKNLLGGSYQQENMSTIEMKINKITDLKTLKFSLLTITPESIITEKMKPNGQRSNVSVAINYLNEELLKLNVIHTRHVQENVIVKYLEPWAEETEAPRLPAHEPIVLARKPLVEKTIVENVLQWGTGAINIDATRVELSNGDDPRLGGNGSWSTDKMAKNVYAGGYEGNEITSSPLGRWPANVVTDGSDEVFSMFPNSNGALGTVDGQNSDNKIYGKRGARPRQEPRNDTGSAARFFYSAKANKEDRTVGYTNTYEINCPMSQELTDEINKYIK